ncbi:MAG TPA: hypothetical protein VLN57_08885 [Xanthobacteraceae bacterium]|jgi:hypothetical protein|nr:hypothetical protein [Xanthobacteraceae bacterium]
MSSMNSSLATADRATHVRVIVLALVGAIAVMMVGLGARAPEMGSAATAATAGIKGPAQKAGVTAVYSINEVTVIR